MTYIVMWCGPTGDADYTANWRYLITGVEK